MRNAVRVLSSIVVVLAALASLAIAQEFTVDKKDAVSDEPDYSPFVDQHYPTRVLWGDTHLHTANSFARDRDPEAALDRLRREVLRDRHAG